MHRYTHMPWQQWPHHNDRVLDHTWQQWGLQGSRRVPVEVNSRPVTIGMVRQLVPLAAGLQHQVLLSHVSC